MKSWKWSSITFCFFTIPYVKWRCLLKIPSIIIWDIAKKIKIGCHKIGDLGKNEVIGLHSTFLYVDTWPSIAAVFEATKIKQSSSTLIDKICLISNTRISSEYHWGYSKFRYLSTSTVVFYLIIERVAIEDRQEANFQMNLSFTQLHRVPIWN